MAIIALLAALIAAGLSRTRAQTKQVACLSQLRQIGIASIAFASDHEDRLPAATTRTLIFGTLISAICALFCLRGSAAADAKPGESLSRPTQLAMERPFGPEGKVIVTVRLAGGEELPLMVDTGAPFTVLDESLAPKLGTKLGTRKAEFAFNSKIVSWDIYRSPRLFADGKLLLNGEKVFTVQRSTIRHPDKGILGMDCLGHYCLQFDFAGGKLLFLDPDHLNTADLGRAFPIDMKAGGIPSLEADLFGYGRMRFVVDTGMEGPFDGMLAPRLFRRLVRGHPTIGPTLYMTVSDGRGASAKIFPRLDLSGELYSELWFSMVELDPKSCSGLLGLGFLGRHTMTINFPKRTLYLKRVGGAPVAGKGSALHTHRSKPEPPRKPSIDRNRPEHHVYLYPC